MPARQPNEPTADTSNGCNQMLPTELKQMTDGSPPEFCSGTEGPSDLPQTAIGNADQPIVHPSPSFLFITCQVGAEGAVKHELSQKWPALRFAYSRPGFLTFKLPEGIPFPDDFNLESTFARACGLSLGKAEGATPLEKAESVWKLIGDRPVEQLHVWERDRFEPGHRDFEPGITPLAIEVEELIRRHPASRLSTASITSPPLLRSPLAGEGLGMGGEPSFDAAETPPPPIPSRERGELTCADTNAERGPLVADVVIVDENEWWVGFHRVHSVASSWPGGLMPGELPEYAVSRVYMKMCEAIAWSGFPMERGEKCIEIGCAPGGASQALLEQGLRVVGIDPAEVDPIVLSHPQFRYIRGRSKEVRRREFVGADWLTCDINLPPSYTLDTVEAIVTYPEVRFRGVLLTLKLAEWSFARELPEWLERIRSWGFRTVSARQLHYNHRELCVAASDFAGAAVSRSPAKETPHRKPKIDRRRRHTPRTP